MSIPGTVDVAGRYGFLPSYSVPSLDRQGTPRPSPNTSEDEIAELANEKCTDSPITESSSGETSPEKMSPTSLRISNTSLPLDLTPRNPKPKSTPSKESPRKPTTPIPKISFQSPLRHEVNPLQCRKWCCRIGRGVDSVIAKIWRLVKKLFSLRLRFTYESPRTTQELV